MVKNKQKTVLNTNEKQNAEHHTIQLQIHHHNGIIHT